MTSITESAICCIFFGTSGRKEVSVPHPADDLSAN